MSCRSYSQYAVPGCAAVSSDRALPCNRECQPRHPNVASVSVVTPATPGRSLTPRRFITPPPSTGQLLAAAGASADWLAYSDDGAQQVAQVATVADTPRVRTPRKAQVFSGVVHHAASEPLTPRAFTHGAVHCPEPGTPRRDVTPCSARNASPRRAPSPWGHRAVGDMTPPAVQRSISVGHAAVPSPRAPNTSDGDSQRAKVLHHATVTDGQPLGAMPSRSPAPVPVGQVATPCRARAVARLAVAPPVSAVSAAPATPRSRDTRAMLTPPPSAPPPNAMPLGRACALPTTPRGGPRTPPPGGAVALPCHAVEAHQRAQQAPQGQQVIFRADSGWASRGSFQASAAAAGFSTPVASTPRAVPTPRCGPWTSNDSRTGPVFSSYPSASASTVTHAAGGSSVIITAQPETPSMAVEPTPQAHLQPVPPPGELWHRPDFLPPGLADPDVSAMSSTLADTTFQDASLLDTVSEDGEHRLRLYDEKWWYQHLEERRGAVAPRDAAVLCQGPSQFPQRCLVAAEEHLAP